MQESVRFQIQHNEGNIHPGDVFVTNHPAAGGTHLPDITVITPVFVEVTFLFVDCFLFLKRDLSTNNKLTYHFLLWHGHIWPVQESSETFFFFFWGGVFLYVSNMKGCSWGVKKERVCPSFGIPRGDGWGKKCPQNLVTKPHNRW